MDENEVVVSTPIVPAMESQPKKKDVKNWLVVGLGVLLVASLVGNGVQISQFKSLDAQRMNLVTEMASNKQTGNVEVPVYNSCNFNEIVDKAVGKQEAIPEDQKLWVNYEDKGGRYTMKIPPGWVTSAGDDTKRWDIATTRVASDDDDSDFISVLPKRDLYRIVCEPIIPGGEYTMDGNRFSLEVLQKSRDEVLEEEKVNQLSEPYDPDMPTDLATVLGLEKIDWNKSYEVYTYETSVALGVAWKHWLISNGRVLVRATFETGSQDQIDNVVRILKTLELK